MHCFIVYMYVFYVIVITCILSCDSIKKFDDDEHTATTEAVVAVSCVSSIRLRAVCSGADGETLGERTQGHGLC